MGLLKYFLASTFVCLAAQSLATAEAKEKLNIRFEKDDYGFQAQEALVFEEARVIHFRNSKLYCAGSSGDWKGTREASYSTDLKQARDELEQVAIRLEKPKRGVAAQIESMPVMKMNPGSPHRLRIFIGATEVTDHPVAAAVSKQIMSEICESKSFRGP